jgi:Arc/MetJ family transcription regulator
MHSMRVTIEIDANELSKIQKITGQKKKSPAISQALSTYLRQQQKQRFIEKALSGGTDFALTNEELEARDQYEAR